MCGRNVFREFPIAVILNAMHSSHAPWPIAFAAFLAVTSVSAAAAPADVVDVIKAGVIGDGTTLNTATIQKAIDQCAGAGGGTISFPAGRYLTGTIQIKSNVTLRLEKNATLLGSTQAADYRNVDPFTDGSGLPLGFALIVAVDAQNVGLEGPGTVDGQGAALKRNQPSYNVRPFLLRWIRCSHVTVRNVFLTNPGAWTSHYSQSSHIVIEGVTIRSRSSETWNNDGIDLDSSDDVRVRDCDVVSGDDALVIKATSAGRPSRDIQAVNCKLSSNANAIKLGTESIGGFEDIAVSNCQITKTTMSGIALNQVDGAFLRRVIISDVTMDGVAIPISLRLGARLKTFRAGDPPKASAGELRDITIRNVSAKNVQTIGILVNGVPGHPVEALTFDNMKLELPGGGSAEDAQKVLPEMEKAYPEYRMFGKTFPASVVYLRHVRGAKFQNMQVTLRQPDARPAAVLIDCEGVAPPDLAADLRKER